jgi:hypothetical protein
MIRDRPCEEETTECPKAQEIKTQLFTDKLEEGEKRRTGYGKENEDTDA